MLLRFLGVSVAFFHDVLMIGVSFGSHVVLLYFFFAAAAALAFFVLASGDEESPSCDILGY